MDEEEVVETVKKVSKPSTFKPKAVEKKVIEMNYEKSSFNLDLVKHRCKVRFNAELVKSKDNEFIFESIDTIIKVKKV